jgi:hypothetical protein
MIHYSHRATLDGKRFAGGKEKLEMFYGLEQSGHEARIFYTRIFYTIIMHMATFNLIKITLVGIHPNPGPSHSRLVI